MFLPRYALALGISIVALLISITLDRLLAPLPPIIQFAIQVPLLVLLVDEGRRALLHYTQIPKEDVDGAFFFAAPMAALGATSLFMDLRKSFQL
jgi:hypothetical protein